MKPQGIRRPTLADQILATDYRESVVQHAWLERTYDALRMAKKFVLDAQATTYFAEMIRRYPRVIADAQDFAIRPFDLMWVEIPFQNFYRTITGRPTDDTGDRTVGYLYMGPTVRVGSLSWSGQWIAGFTPIEYTLHRPMPVDEQQQLAEKLDVSRLFLDLWFWGESAEAFTKTGTVTDDDLEQAWDREGLRALRANHSAGLAPIRTKYKNLIYSKVVNGSAGDLRNMVALLLFLNRTTDIQYEQEVGMAHKVINRKPRPMLPHRVITLKLDPLPRLKRLGAGIGVRRRLHDVRGHYKHDHTARESGCQHGTQKFGDWGEWWEEIEPLRWVCSNCGGKRWWQPEHHRGSADVGIIKQQDYAVTK